jgi:hypothetical protein
MDCSVPWPIQAREQLSVSEGVSTNVNKFHLCFVSKFLQTNVHKHAKHISITSARVYSIIIRKFDNCRQSNK